MIHQDVGVGLLKMSDFEIIIPGLSRIGGFFPWIGDDQVPNHSVFVTLVVQAAALNMCEMSTVYRGLTSKDWL